MKIHFIGICGTGMGAVAELLQAAGHEVRGSDEHVYPPMSTQLEHAGIALMEGLPIATSTGSRMLWSSGTSAGATM